MNETSIRLQPLAATTSFYVRAGKRWFDAASAAVGLGILSPVFALAFILIKLTSSGPAFFRQVRTGRFGRTFRIWKFRSMYCSASDAGTRITAAGDSRITPVGRWLRRTKLDELPQLINVLRGEMSLVGPRPEIPEYTRDYTSRQRAVLYVRPGITGPAANQYICEEDLLAGRRDMEEFYLSTVLPAKLEMDIAYSEGVRFVGDLRFITQTLANILRQIGRRARRWASVLSGWGSAQERILLTIADRLHRTMQATGFYSRTVQVMLDGASFAVAASAAFLVGFNGWPSGVGRQQWFFWMPTLVVARLALGAALKLYRHVWRFTSFLDAVEVTRCIALFSASLAALRLFYPAGAPLAAMLRLRPGVIALEGLLSLAALLTIRGVRRVHYACVRRAEATSATPPKRVLLYGAGRAGIMLRKELQTNRAYRVIGFVDDDPKKVHAVISSTQVLSSGADLGRLVAQHRVDEVIICMATASRHTLAATLQKCRRANVPAKIIPSLQEMLAGNLPISQFHETRVEELLGRESVEVLDRVNAARPAYRGKRVLVTGAGGSIGSELVRQLVRLGPEKIAILDKDENSIFDLEQELLSKKSGVHIAPQIADVRDAERLSAIFAEIRPQHVFHAAAHKHVPLMETHPCEAVMNNVGGTLNMLRMAEEFRAEKFVFISSDKAVNPANVMGTTKRIGEILVQASARESAAQFACVRFGNVLGSRGSVIPLFKRQIAAGGPVTVTHPEITRYFMTIEEAVQLILCAGTLARGGEVFVLDMGNPRNILELAREMIFLSGFEPEKDIQTAITGLRPGEKLSEELTAPCERVSATPIEKLLVIQPQFNHRDAFMSDLERLLRSAKANDRERVREILREIDLGFQPQAPQALAAASSRCTATASLEPAAPLRPDLPQSSLQAS